MEVEVEQAKLAGWATGGPAAPLEKPMASLKSKVPAASATLTFCMPVLVSSPSTGRNVHLTFLPEEEEWRGGKEGAGGWAPGARGHCAGGVAGG